MNAHAIPYENTHTIPYEYEPISYTGTDFPPSKEEDTGTTLRREIEYRTFLEQALSIYLDFTDRDALPRLSTTIPLAANDRRTSQHEDDDGVRISTLVDEILSDLRALKGLRADWDDEGAPAPAVEAVDAALAFTRLWQFSGRMLDVGIAANGAPVLNILDTDGRAVGAVDFLASNSFIFCFVKEGVIRDSGEGKVSDPSNRRQFFARLEQFFADE